MGVIRSNNRFWDFTKSDPGKDINTEDSNDTEKYLLTLLRKLDFYKDNNYDKFNKNNKDNILDEEIIRVYSRERGLIHLKIAMNRTKSDDHTFIGHSITRCSECKTFLTNYKKVRYFDCEICKEEWDPLKSIYKQNEKINFCKKCSTYFCKNVPLIF